jgi:hypothetical protein
VGLCLSGRLLDFLTTEAEEMGGLAKSAAARALVLALLERWVEEEQLDVDYGARPGTSRPRGAHLRYERSVWFSDDEHALLRTYAAGRGLALGAALREALRIEIYARRVDRGLPIIGDYVD